MADGKLTPEQMQKKFKATIKEGRGGGAFVEVPFDVKAELGAARAKVNATFDGEPYRGSIAPMGGAYLIGILKDIRKKIGKDIGDVVTVTLEPDTAPREIAIPADAAKALKAAKLLDAFERMSYSHRKEHVRAIEDAKQPATRQRRIDKMIEDLGKRGR